MTHLKEKRFSTHWWKNWMFVAIGSFLVALGYVLFITPYTIVPGGVYGAGVVLNYLFPNIQVGTFGLMLDIPMLLIAFKVFGGSFGTRTIVCALLTPLFMNTMTTLVGGTDPAVILGGRIDLSNDLLIACIFGGVIIGAGVGLVVKTHATTGGTDVLAMILTKYAKIKFSNSVLIIDSLVVVFGILIIGDWKLPLYALITIFTISQTINFIISGETYDKLLFIITEKHDEVRDFILEEMERGATYIKSHGMYTQEEKDLIFLVISRNEFGIVQTKIKEIDKDAFVVVVDASETFGDGFKSFPDEKHNPTIT